MARSKKDPASVDWNALLEQVDTSSMDPNLYFITEGRHRLKLLPADGDDPRNFFIPVQRTWQGQQRTRFLIRAIVFGRDDNPSTQKGVIVNKTVLRNILTLLTEDYDLFDHEEGYGITIIRAGKGLDSSYGVMPSKNTVANPNDIEEMTLSLKELAAVLEEQDKNRATNTTGSTDGTPKPAASGPAGGGDW